MEKKKLLLVVVIIIGCSFYSGCSREVPINERPMYGNMPPTPELQEVHNQFIKEAIEGAGSKEAAFKKAMGIANYYVSKGDLRTAMKRVNQAWLLDPNNVEVYYLFGSITRIQGKTDETIGHYKRALEIDPAHAMVMCNLGREYYHKAYESYRRQKKAEMKEYLKEAQKLYEKASRLATLDADLGYIYYQWAVSLLLGKDHADAWEKVKLTRRYDASYIEPAFISELSKFMSEN